MSLNILYPNGGVMAQLVYIWDVATLSPIVWDGSLTVGTVVIGTVNQGTSPWVVRDSNIDVLLSTRTKPSDQQHVIVDSGFPSDIAQETGGNLATIAGKDFATQTTLALIKAKTDNLDVALSTRTKPADSQHITVDNIPAVTQSGTWTVQPGNTANTTAWKVDGSAVTQPTKEIRSATAITSQVADNASSVTLLASNANRLGATIENDSTATLYVKFGTTASLTNYTVQLIQGAYYEVPYGYTGRIDGIWASAPGTGSARITELT